MAEAASTGGRYTPPSTRPSAVIDARLAEELFPGELAVGRTVVRSSTRVRYNVVGVVETVRYDTTRSAPGSLFEIQAPQAIDVIRPLHFVVSTEGPADEQIGAVLSVFRQSFPDTLLLSVRDARSLIAEERVRERMGATVFSWFGVAAALLGLTGTYGLVAFFILRQRRELGIRSALGAGWPHLLKLVAVRAVVPSALGAFGGLLLAFWASKLVSTIIAGASTTGYLASIVSGLSLVAASMLTACFAGRGLRGIREADLLREA
jgi:putative ABC transport system permease protein